MTKRTEAEERALVEGFQPVIASRQNPDPLSDEAEEECRRALHKAVFEVLDWDLEDQPDIMEAFSKICVVAYAVGWAYHLNDTVDWLRLVHEYPEKREEFERNIMHNELNGDETDTREDGNELEYIESKLHETSQIQQCTSAR